MMLEILIKMVKLLKSKKIKFFAQTNNFKLKDTFEFKKTNKRI